LDQQQEDPHATANFRSARFDLDSLYGLGPTQQPELYDPHDPDKFLITGLNDPSVPDDLPRKSDGTAFIGDPRNEENLIVCQLHLAFLKLHNKVVDHLRTQGVPGAQVFEEARRLTRWHFQWVIVHDFLRRFVGQPLIDQLLDVRSHGPAKVKLAFYKPKNPNKPMMPVEFAAAAYRFGHSIIRPGYRVNATTGAAFFADQPTDRDLNGFRPIPPPLVVEWRNFFEIPGVAGPPANLTRKIDSKLSVPLLHLPQSVVPPPDTHTSLPERNLLRGKRLGLPSGQQVAQAMGVRAMTNEELGLGSEPGWNGEAPLWFYILKEAELQHNGEQLGPVGGRIVAEVVLGLLDHDKTSYLSVDPLFQPGPPIAPAPRHFAMGDLLKFAGAA
jgi:hypothetical protein